MMKRTRYWTLHLVTGLVIVLLLGIHMAIFHLDYLLGYGKPLSYDSVVMRAKQVFYLVMYTLLLGTALYHGLYGFRKIVFELSPGKKLEGVITAGIVAAGIFVFVCGTFVVIKMFVTS